MSDDNLRVFSFRSTLKRILLRNLDKVYFFLSDLLGAPPQKRKDIPEADLRLGPLRKSLIAMDKPELVISGVVNDELADFVFGALAYLRTKGSPSLRVCISSGGGNVGNGLLIFDLLKSYEGETTGCVVGHAYSMAAIILQACVIRKATRHSRILIHHVGREDITLDDLEDTERLGKIVDGARGSQQRLYSILAYQTKRSEEEIKQRCALDKPMSAEEALEFGLIDEIV